LTFFYSVAYNCFNTLQKSFI